MGRAGHVERVDGGTEEWGVVLGEGRAHAVFCQQILYTERVAELERCGGAIASQVAIVGLAKSRRVGHARIKVSVEGPEERLHSESVLMPRRLWVCVLAWCCVRCVAPAMPRDMMGSGPLMNRRRCCQARRVWRCSVRARNRFVIWNLSPLLSLSPAQ